MGPAWRSAVGGTVSGEHGVLYDGNEVLILAPHAGAWLRAAHGPARLVPALHQVVAAGADTRPGRVHGGGDHGQLRGGGGHQVGATHAEELDAMREVP